MGLADIVPGVSGGTVAFVTGIYDELVASISSVNIEFAKKILKFEIKSALTHINIKFLLPLFCGIIIAVVSMSRVMHYFMNNYTVLTWSLFFGLILASILFMMKQMDCLKNHKVILSMMTGAVIGNMVISLIPVTTPDSPAFLFGSGMIAICAMILPGISGSFLLLILGKYEFVTGALKNPFSLESINTIVIFSLGCLVGLLSFSKVLNYLLKAHRTILMSFLIGFMIASLKKIWPWKEVIESKIIRGKTYILKEINIYPSELSQEVIWAFFLALIGFILVFTIERVSKRN